ncbi:hypothetical protein [Clostridium sp.]|uniref:hypothetical protein n=1 Tax=Clostridium sp. TaxID=1506 RepID=UPI001A484307|nr:hypothetical protein [Clostridium sp.]MBK5241116.1 hypothetical protein [Clostridium sp.]
MYTCNHCKNKFPNEPYLCYPSRKKYCSLECIPDSGMDRPYSFQYFNLIDSIRDIEASIDEISTLEDRIDLENEANELSTYYTLEIYGDDEGFFYKRQIGLTLLILDKLYETIHNIFIERKVQLRTATVICWDALTQLVGEEASEMIFIYFENSMAGVPYENVYYADPNYYDYLGCFKDMLCVDTQVQAENIKNIYYESLNFFKSLFTKKQLEILADSENCVHIDTLVRCVVCNEWGPSSDTSFDDNLNLYKCGQYMC